jgi:hypothetical protein
MRDRIDIDHTHSQAISQEIGERLQALLREPPEPAAGFRKKIELLGEFEVQSPPIAAGAQRIEKGPGEERRGRGQWLRWLRPR